MTAVTANKNLRTSIAAGTSQAAGGSTTGTAFDLSTTPAPSEATCKITNGATGPTIGAVMKLMVSGDNTNWKTHRSFRGGVANSAVYEFSATIPAAFKHARWDGGENTGQAVTVEGFIHEITSLTIA